MEGGGEPWGGEGRCEELWRVVGSCGEVRGGVRSYGGGGEPWGGKGRCGEL
jgi:hypothetical protein